MPGYNSPRRGTARTVPNIFVLFYVLFLYCSMYCVCVVLCIVFVLFYVLFLYCSMYCFCVVLCIVCFLSFCVLFVCKCVLYYCHQVSIQLQLTNISYHIHFTSLFRRAVSTKGHFKVSIALIFLTLHDDYNKYT
jgi:hypothetical protein